MASLTFVCRQGDESLEPVEVLLRENPVPSCVCPICRAPVALIQRRIRPRGRPPVEAHARHVQGGAGCSPGMESEAHESTKLGLRDCLRARLASEGPEAPIWAMLPRLGRPVLQCISIPWNAVEPEVSLTGGSLRADVGLLRREARRGAGGVLLLAVEIRDHHPVDADKAKLFERLGIPWIEVEAQPAGSNTPTCPLPDGSVSRPIPVLRSGGIAVT